MGTRATIAFCGDDGAEWARIYLHANGHLARELLVEFFEAEMTAHNAGTRDLRWADPSYLAARFVAWQSDRTGNGIGLVPPSQQERWHWRVRAVVDGTSPHSWPIIEQVTPVPIDTANDFLFGINGAGIIAPTLPVGPMDRGRALRAAAWLACIADPGGDEFAAVLEAVRST